MNYNMIKDVLDLVKEFDDLNHQNDDYTHNVDGFKSWIGDSLKGVGEEVEPNWEGKEEGRGPDSVINTMLVHMNRYAKTYSKSAIHNSEFSTQEDFIYLINLSAFGSMTKMELIKRNVQEKSVGMLIINRLIRQGWVDQVDSEVDKRSKLISINEKGLEALENQMDKVRIASEVVTGNLHHNEKIQLIKILQKLDAFHHPIYLKNIDTSDLLNEAMKKVRIN